MQYKVRTKKYEQHIHRQDTQDLAPACPDTHSFQQLPCVCICTGANVAHHWAHFQVPMVCVHQLFPYMGMGVVGWG